jgi:hypothetical protein
MSPRTTLCVLAVMLAIPAYRASAQDKDQEATAKSRIVAAMPTWPAWAQDKDQEATAKSRIVSVMLFKNGLAVVKREVTVPAAGAYRLETAAEPVHGTFWIESDAKVEAAVKMRDVEMPLHSSAMVNLQEELGGKKVTIYFKNDKLPPMSGTLLKMAAKPSADAAIPIHDASAIKDRFYILQTPKGRLYVTPSEIATVLAEDVQDKVTQRKPVLVLSVAKTEKQPKIYVTYLAHGLAWAPSYLVDTTDPKKL